MVKSVISLFRNVHTSLQTWVPGANFPKNVGVVIEYFEPFLPCNTNIGLVLSFLGVEVVATTPLSTKVTPMMGTTLFFIRFSSVSESCDSTQLTTHTLADPGGGGQRGHAPPPPKAPRLSFGPPKTSNESHARRLIKRKRKKTKEISTLLSLKNSKFRACGAVTPFHSHIR